MTTTSIVMMIVAMCTIWGGLAVAAWNLYSRPDQSALEDDVPPST